MGDLREPLHGREQSFSTDNVLCPEHVRLSNLRAPELVHIHGRSVEPIRLEGLEVRVAAIDSRRALGSASGVGIWVPSVVEGLNILA